MACSIDRRFVALAGLLLCPFLCAQEVGDSSADAAAGQAEEEVDIGFLEFLGQWETDGGEWVAPEDLADENIAALIAEMVQTDDEDSQ